MTTLLKSGKPMEELKKLMNSTPSPQKKGVDTTKYAGAIKTDIDPLEYQKMMRDEWR